MDRYQVDHLTVNMVADTSESEPIDVRHAGDVSVKVPASWAPAALGLKAAPIRTTTYGPVYVNRVYTTEGSIPLQHYSVATGRVFLFDVRALAHVRLWSQTGGATAVTQTAGLAFPVVRKW